VTIPALLIRDEPLERRREERWRVRLGARWLDCRPGVRPLTVLDLSASGFLVEADRTLPIGTCMIVELPDETCKICKIVWSSGNFHGAEFSDPLSASELQGIIDAASVVPLPIALGEPAASDIGLSAQPGSLPDPLTGEDAKFSLTTSARIIVGTAAMLWALLALSLWFAID
jgi:hypothetical protein